MNREEYKTIYQYQLRDLLHLFKENEYTLAPSPNDVRDLYLGWNISNIPTQNIIEILTDPITVDLWHQVLVPKYFDCIIAESEIKLDTELDEIEIEKNNIIFGKFWRLFESILYETFDKYYYTIKFYDENVDKLMSQITSNVETKSRDNIIPQIDTADPYDTEFTNRSSTGIVTSSSSGGTVAQRLAELDHLRYNKLREWADEFAPLFKF